MFIALECYYLKSLTKEEIEMVTFKKVKSGFFYGFGKDLIMDSWRFDIYLWDRKEKQRGG